MNALPSLRAIHVGAAALAIVACVPYAFLKLVWLAGSSLGAATPEGAASLHDPRHTVGNAITLGMDLVVVVLALALTLRKGLTVPSPLLLFPMWVGTGLLAPIAVGLPLGLIGQAAVGGPPAPTDNELETWVYAIVYGGFIVQAGGLLTAFLLYARIRWTALFRAGLAEPPQEPNGSVGLRLLTDGAAAVGFVYAAVHVGWALAGEDMAAPPGFETAAQRTFLATVAVLVAAGAGATLLLARGRRVPQSRERTIVLIAIGWVGTAVAFGSGLAELGLAPPDRMALITSFTLAVGSLSGLIMGAAGSRQITPVNSGAPRVSPGHVVRIQPQAPGHRSWAGDNPRARTSPLLDAAAGHRVDTAPRDPVSIDSASPALLKFVLHVPGDAAKRVLLTEFVALRLRAKPLMMQQEPRATPSSNETWLLFEGLSGSRSRRPS